MSPGLLLPARPGSSSSSPKGCPAIPSRGSRPLTATPRVPAVRPVCECSGPARLPGHQIASGLCRSALTRAIVARTRPRGPATYSRTAAVLSHVASIPSGHPAQLLRTVQSPAVPVGRLGDGMVARCRRAITLQTSGSAAPAQPGRHQGSRQPDRCRQRRSSQSVLWPHPQAADAVSQPREARYQPPPATRTSPPSSRTRLTISSMTSGTGSAATPQSGQQASASRLSVPHRPHSYPGTRPSAGTTRV